MTADREGRRRAERLLGAYPRAWRARYGEEFVELLLADFEDRPRSLRRSADVFASGILARLRVAGLAGASARSADELRASLAALGCAVAAFFTFGVAMWSQVTIGWRWEPPASAAVAGGMLAMSAAVLLIAVLAVLAAVPMVWAFVRAMRSPTAKLLRPPVLVTVGSTVLVTGTRHFEDRWPGTGGHPWSYHALVSSGVAAFGWSATRGVSSYWMHPGALRTFPVAEVAWMPISLAAILCTAVGLTKTVRRLELSKRTMRYEARLAGGAVAAMVVFIGGAGSWVIADDAPGPTGIYRVGVIDVVGLVAMSIALIAAYRAATRARIVGWHLSGTVARAADIVEP